jgi:tRNA(Ile)-lysidine synthase TilS/MesJ
MQIPWEYVIPVIVGAFGAFGTVLGFLIKSVDKAARNHWKQKFDQLEKDTQLATRHTEEMLGAQAQRITQYFEAHDRLRDRWEEFLREYLKIDSTRGQKIDALFRVVDQMQAAVREISPNVNTKIEEAFTHSLSELKLYVRDQLREERHGK